MPRVPAGRTGLLFVAPEAAASRALLPGCLPLFQDGFRIVCVATLLGGLTGCAALDAPGPSHGSRETQAEELTWQALHVVDTAQTLQIAAHPECYHEDQSAVLLGRGPNAGQVALWSAASAALHAGLTALIEERDERWLQRTWQFLSIVPTALTVSHNFRLGLGLHSASPQSHGYCEPRAPGGPTTGTPPPHPPTTGVAPVVRGPVRPVGS